MDERKAARLAAMIAEQGGEMEPPWSRLPWIQRWSIGWRMGIGEDYGVMWTNFSDEKLHGLTEALAYLRRHPKAPRTWADWVARWLSDVERRAELEAEADEDGDEEGEEEGEGEEADDEDEEDEEDDSDEADGDAADADSEEEDEDEDVDLDVYAYDDDDDEDDEDEDDEEELHWLAFVEAEGLTGDDAAYPAFVRNALAREGMTAPWTWKGAADGPDSTLRYSARELGWWARWMAQECRDVAAYLAAQPSPSPEWADVAAAIAAREDAPWLTLTGGARALLPSMVRHGALPPPWLGGHPPIDDVDWEDDADDRHRWAWWVFETFEDSASWRAYLERWPPPPAWRDKLHGVLFPSLTR